MRLWSGAIALCLALAVGGCGGSQKDPCAGVVCTASDSCHETGTCDHGSGKCSTPAKADGAACDDGNSNTTGDKCTNGVCSGTVVVDLCAGKACNALDACHVAGVC